MEAIIKNLCKMRNVQRLSGTHKSRSYNLLEHSFLVGSLFAEFCEEEGIEVSYKELKTILYHDILETETGDLIYPVKNLNRLTRDCWNAIEESVLAENPQLRPYSDESLSNILSPEKLHIFKCCDLLELWVFCREEEVYGNGSIEIKNVLKTCQEILSSCGVPSIIEFIKNYQP